MRKVALFLFEVDEIMPNYLSIFYTIFASIYLGSLSYAPYPGQFLVKALPIALLLLFSLWSLKHKLKVVVGGALAASMAGDIMLALSFENSFVYGLGCFFVAHLAYIVCFFVLRSNANNVAIPNKRNTLLLGFACCLIIAFAFVVARHILPATEQLFFPVLAYISVISIMGVTAILVARSWLIALGAIVFVVSDTILAQATFMDPITLSEFAVMLTYYAAQYLLTRGVMESSQTT